MNKCELRKPRLLQQAFYAHRIAVSSRGTRILVSILIAVGILTSLAATAVAVYNKIVVIEPSRSINGLDEAIRKANFPIWVASTGDLVSIREIVPGTDSTAIFFLDYRLNDGRRFYLQEEKAHPLIFPRNYDFSGILDENVDINGQKGLLYQEPLTTEVNGEYRYGWQGPKLYWQADATTLRLQGKIDSIFTSEEIIAIARGLHEVK